MKNSDYMAFVDFITPTIKLAIGNAVEPLMSRLKSLEDGFKGIVIPEIPEFPEIPEIDMEAINGPMKALSDTVESLLKDLESLSSKIDGVESNQKKIAEDAVKALEPGLHSLIEAGVVETKSMIPSAIQGDPGKDADMDQVKRWIDEAVAALPKAKDGIGASGAVIDRDGNLVLTMTDGSIHKMGVVVGASVDMEAVESLVSKAVDALPKAKDGEDGEDGVSPEPSVVAASLKSLVLDDVIEHVKQVAAQETEKLIPGVDQVAAAVQADITKAVEQNFHDVFPAQMDTLKAMIKTEIESIPVPQDGKSVTVDEVYEAIREDVLIRIHQSVKSAVEAIPAPQDGKSVSLEEVVAEIEPTIKKQIDASTDRFEVASGETIKNFFNETKGSLDAHFETLKATVKDGEDGKSVSPEEVKAMVESVAAPIIDEIKSSSASVQSAVARVDEAIKAIPEVKDGADGTSVSVAEVTEIVKSQIEPFVAGARESIDTAIKAIPVPKDGADADMEAITQTINSKIEQGIAGVADEAAKAMDLALAKIEMPKEVIEAVKREAKLYADALFAEIPVHIKSADINRSGQLVINKSDGSTQTLGPVVGKDGEDGIDADNIKLSVKQSVENPREISVILNNGGAKEIVQKLHIPMMIFKGKFVAGTDYQKGDCVQWGRYLWHAKKDTAMEPKSTDGPASDWEIAAHPGRDGRDGKDLTPEEVKKPKEPIKLK